MASKSPDPFAEMHAQVERYAEQLVDVTDAEQRLLATLARLWTVKSALVSRLAQAAAAVAKFDVQH